MWRLGWTIFKKNKRCEGPEEDWKRHNKGHLPSVNHCAAACLGMTKWFIYGKSENGNDKCNQGCCNDQGCQCICKAGITMDTGKGLICNLKDDYGYDIYDLPDSAGFKSFLASIFVLKPLSLYNFSKLLFKKMFKLHP